MTVIALFCLLATRETAEVSLSDEDLDAVEFAPGTGAMTRYLFRNVLGEFVPWVRAIEFGTTCLIAGGYFRPTNTTTNG